jgi:hypothetical protein
LALLALVGFATAVAMSSQAGRDAWPEDISPKDVAVAIIDDQNATHKRAGMT